MVGAEAAEARHLLDISYPVREGIVTNWEEMEHIWKYTFQGMGMRREKGQSRKPRSSPYVRSMRWRS